MSPTSYTIPPPSYADQPPKPSDQQPLLSPSNPLKQTSGPAWAHTRDYSDEEAGPADDFNVPVSQATIEIRMAFIRKV